MANICPNIAFSVCYMSYIIMEAWLPSFPMIPISLVYSFSEMNTSFMNGVGVHSVKCQISISVALHNITQCTAQSSVPSLCLLSHSFNNDHYYHAPYSDMPRFCHLWIKPVPFCKCILDIEFVSGVGQENVLLGQHAVQT